MNREEAIKIVKSHYPANKQMLNEALETLIPELKEDEDVLTWLKNYISEEAKCLSMDIRDNDDRITLKKLRDSLAWLEKHSESDETKAKVFLINKGYPIDTNGIFPTYEEMYNIIREGLENQREHKVGDNIESKFKVGDWVVKGDVIAQILDVQEQYYVGSDTEGKDFTASRFLSDDRIHLWTIDDAKDGDIIYAESKFDSFDFIEIFSSLENGNFWGYCDVSSDSDIYSDELECWEFDRAKGFIALRRYNFYPATQEQRDLLFRRMKEAGYEWDAENKKLRTI